MYFPCVRTAHPKVLRYDKRASRIDYSPNTIKETTGACSAPASNCILTTTTLHEVQHPQARTFHVIFEPAWLGLQAQDNRDNPPRASRSLPLSPYLSPYLNPFFVSSFLPTPYSLLGIRQASLKWFYLQPPEPCPHIIFQAKQYLNIITEKCL